MSPITSWNIIFPEEKSDEAESEEESDEESGEEYEKSDEKSDEESGEESDEESDEEESKEAKTYWKRMDIALKDPMLAGSYAHEILTRLRFRIYTCIVMEDIAQLEEIFIGIKNLSENMKRVHADFIYQLVFTARGNPDFPSSPIVLRHLS